MTTSTLTIIKKTWQLAFALSLSRLFNMITGFVGTLMIARLGHNVLAASALISSTQATLFLISISMLFSIGVVIGHAYGGKRYEEIGSVFQQGLLLATLICIPVIIIQCNIGSILIACGQNPQVAAINAHYFRAYSFAIPAFLWMISCQQFVLAVNKQRFVLFMSVVTLIISVTLSYSLVYGHFGLPRLGVTGLALAYSIQGWAALLAYLAFCYCNKYFKEYKVFQWRFRQNFHLLKKIFSIGWPITLQFAGDLLSFFVTTLMIGWLGTNELAAQQIVTQYFLLLVVPIFAISQASAILVGQARGAGAIHEIKRYGSTTLLIGLTFSLIAITLFIFFPHTLIRLYLGQGQELNLTMQHLASIIFILTGLRLFFDAALEIKTGSLRGLYDTKFPMVTGLILTWLITIPLCYLFGFYYHWGLIGITSASIVGTILAATIIYIRWLWQCNKFINT